MTEPDRPQGAGVGKIVLIVLAVLVGLGLLCCAGCWFAGGRVAWQVAGPQIAMTQEFSSKHGEGAVLLALPDPNAQNPQEMTFILTAQVQKPLTPELVTQIQDDAWRAYASAFAKGGLGVSRVAVAQHGPTPDWKANTVTAEEVAQRTGVPAPPDGEFLHEFKKDAVEDKVKLEVKVTPPTAPEEGQK